MKNGLSARLTNLEGSQEPPVQQIGGPAEALARAAAEGRHILVLALPKCPGVPTRSLPSQRISEKGS
jgi:hypothetical protein